MSEFLEVAKTLLLAEKRPMRIPEIISLAKDRGLLSDKISGKTPAQTMKSKITVHILNKGEESYFVRTGPGLFSIRQLIADKTKILPAPPKIKNKPTENVLVFENSWLDRNNKRFQGIKTISQWKNFFKDLKNANVCRYIKRMDAELDSNFKQIVTYALIVKENKILSFKRGSFNRSEDFLKGSYCIGFGGHVSGEDLDLFSLDDYGITSGAKREITEELKLPTTDLVNLNTKNKLKLIGFLNDDSSTVGQRHFALVFKYEVSDDENWKSPAYGEKSITQLRWVEPAKLNRDLREFEYWSQLCFQSFYKAAVRSLPSYRILRPAKLKKAKVLCFVGPVGSGKSEAAKILKDKFKFPVVMTGPIVASLIGLPPIPKTSREIFQNAAERFIRNPSGPKMLADKIFLELKKYKTSRIIIDGIRQGSTLEELKRNVGKNNISIIYVHTPPNVAYEFFKSREAPHGSFDDFLRLRNSPVEGEVSTMASFADAVIYNGEGQRVLKETVIKFIKEIQGGIV